MSRLAVLLTAALGLSSCFDVPKIESAPYYLDTFNDGDLQPRAPGFEPWQCGTFIAGGSDGGTDASAADGGAGASCAIEQVGEHAMALTVRFQLHEPPDETKQTVGAEVATHTAGRAVDLRRFRQMIFSGILESGNPPLPGGTQLAVEITCRGALDGGSAVTQTVDNVNIGSDWAFFLLALDDFLPFDRPCLLQAESIRFSVRPGLMDGLSAAGTLSLDDIFFR